MSVAHGILALLNHPFAVEGHELHISGSVGVSLYPDAGPDPASVVHQADQAMYRSKQNGRNRVTLFSAGAPSPVVSPAGLPQAETARA